MRKDITVGIEMIDKWKVISSGSGMVPQAIRERDAYPQGFSHDRSSASPGQSVTETYLFIGPFDVKKQAESCLAYLNTRFFRFLMSFCISIPQHHHSDTYTFVPSSTWTKRWTDETLYKKYGLTKDDIAFIESMVRPMEDER